MNATIDRYRTWLVCAVMGVCLYAHTAHAESRTRQVEIRDGGMSYEITVHAVYVTELNFPDELTHVSISDKDAFRIHATERRVVVRPQKTTAAGTLANIVIESRSWRMMILMRVAAHPADAVLSVTFTRPAPAQDPGTAAEQGSDTAAAPDDADKPGKGTLAEQSGSNAAAPGDAANPGKDTATGKGATNDNRPESRPDRQASAAEQDSRHAAALGDAANPGKDAATGKGATDDNTPGPPAPTPDPAGKPARTHPARGELPVSVQVHGTIGHAVIGDRMAADQTDGVLLAGVTARIGYPANRYLGYDAGLSVAGSGAAHIPGVMLDRDSGEMVRTMMLARFELGASARLPVRVTPVVRVALGVQSRAWLASRLVLASGAAVEGPDDTLLVDLTGSASVGIDVRITHAWRAGAGVTALRAAPLDNGPLFEAWEGSIHVRWN